MNRIQHDEAYDVLLHACCGPCAEYPARLFHEEGIRFLGWFYNPNIHPAVENQRRREHFLRLSEKLGFAAIAEPDCEPETWLAWPADEKTENGTAGLPGDVSGLRSRCRMCYRRRLGAAAAKAAELGIPAFTTTLLISPWQDHEALKEIGYEVAKEHGVTFIYRDFRPGFRQGQQWAREDGLYRQKYCGCLPSLDDSQFKEKILMDLDLLSKQI